MKVEIRQVSSLEKVFLDKNQEFEEIKKGSALKGEKYSYQIALSLSEYDNSFADMKISLDSEINDYITIYNVENIPGELTYYREMFGGNDDDYLVKGPGVFPDLLVPCENIIKIKEKMWKAIWIEVSIPDDAKPGVYPINVTFSNKEGDFSHTQDFTLEIINAVLPKQELTYSNWFHADCLYTYYNVEPLSEKHFEIIYNFMKTAAEYGMNTILTPVFTPPLDVDVGGERPTIQLVDISYSDNRYEFNFANLKRWVDLAHKAGLKKFEIAHFFTQWGAASTPKIIVNGEKKFGWHVKATDAEYEEFLMQFVPALIKFFKDEGIEKNIIFHVSDEPIESNLLSYKAAKEILIRYTEDIPVVDAVSHYELYEKKVVENPIVAIDSIDGFIEKGAENIYAYCCCAQPVKVSNRFFAMPSSRNRILGVQLYKFNITGFWHWGFNFYFSGRSRNYINPYLVTDAGGSFPSGDAFIVYPGANGDALKSLRLIVFNEGLQDLRALLMAEQLVGRDELIKIIDAQVNVTFSSYPKGAAYILELRETVNNIIKKYSKNQMK